MAIYCKNCEESTMDHSGYEEGLCDICWKKKNNMNIIEQKIKELREKYLDCFGDMVSEQMDFEDDMKSLVQVVQMSRSENPKITVPISLDDAEELKYGREFDWTFPTQVEGEYVDVHVKLEDEGDIDDTDDIDSDTT